MADVFISYAQADREWVHRLASALEQAGLTVWWDLKLAPGERFREVIRRELAAARSVIVVWSAASIESDWVSDEAEEAKAQKRLVPVLKDRVAPPHGFRQLQTTDLSDWGSSESAEFRQLVQTIKRMSIGTSASLSARPGNAGSELPNEATGGQVAGAMEQLLELARERKLDRVGAAYAVTAWLVVQAASIAFPAFDAPPSALRWLIVALIAGFPPTLVLTWFAQPRTAAVLKPLSPRDWLLFGLIGLVAVLLAVQFSMGMYWRRGAPAASPSGAQTASSIAVLPFANLSGDPKKVYFSDGIADQLITELAQTPSLRVAARSSSFSFRGRDVDVKTVAQKLGVRAVLEGSVREAGNRVRIAAELVDASNGFQIWSQSYDRDLTNILSLQDEIARAITEAVAERFLGHAVAANRNHPKPQAIDPEAYKAYLQGQYYFAQRTKEGVLRAIDLFTRAVALAPKYADGFAALADAHATAALDYQVPGAVPAALEAVNKALALDPKNPTAIIARVTAELLQWQWRAAAADMRRLSQLHVNSAPVWHMRALFFDYMGLTQFCGAAEERAIQLDPLSFIDHYNLALYRVRQKRYDDAARVAAQALALQPASPDVQQLKIQIALARHDVDAAERILSALVSQTGEKSPYVAAGRFFIFVAKKDFAAAHKFADEVAKQFPSSDITANDLGIAYAMANDLDTALKWFRRAIDLHEPQFLPVEYTNPEPVKLYADPRWKALRAEPEVHDWETARTEIAREFQAGE